MCLGSSFQVMWVEASFPTEAYTIGPAVCLWMYVCLCFCVYICMCVHTCFYMSLSIWVCVCIGMCVCVKMCVYVSLCIYVCPYAGVYCMYICVYVCLCISVCMYWIYVLVSSTAGLYPPVASCDIPQVVTTKKVSRHCQIFPGRQHYSSWESLGHNSIEQLCLQFLSGWQPPVNKKKLGKSPVQKLEPKGFQVLKVLRRSPISENAHPSLLPGAQIPRNAVKIGSRKTFAEHVAGFFFWSREPVSMIKVAQKERPS